MRCMFCMGMFQEGTAWETICSLQCAREWFFRRFKRGNEKEFLSWARAHEREIGKGGKAVYPRAGGMSRIVVRPWTERDRYIASRYRDVGLGCGAVGIHTLLPSQKGIMYETLNEDQDDQSSASYLISDGLINNSFSE